MASIYVKVFGNSACPNSRRDQFFVRSQATPSVKVTPLAADIDGERPEPRVEEREGYWVLKEKFRQAINPQEKMKIEKEPMKLFMENGIEELAKIPLEEIDKSKLTKDDIDSRLKWLGLFHRRKHQYGRFMMRLKLPNGVTTSAQTRYLASVIRQYGKEGCGDVTTRQNWQIRGIVLSDVPEILKGLEKVGLTSLQSGMDNVRNPVGNPLAGIDPHEIVDTIPYTNLLSQFVTANSRGNPAFTNLPRKWNVCVVGSHDLYEHPHINDLAYMPALKHGVLGFNLLVGGFFSPKRCAEAIPLDAWVPADDIVPVCKAILETYRDLGTRGNRQKTRMMWLIDELAESTVESGGYYGYPVDSSVLQVKSVVESGEYYYHPLDSMIRRAGLLDFSLAIDRCNHVHGLEAFRSEVVKRMPQQKLGRASSEDLVQKGWERREYIGVHPQKQEGYSFIGLHIPVGRLQVDEMDDLARIADEYGTGELRLTVEQNIIIPNIENSKLETLLKEPLLKERFSPEPPFLMKGLVACTGSQFCGQAIIETKARALRITEEVQRRVFVTRPVRIHWTGCPNSCGQVQVADIGFMGCMTRNKNGKTVEGVDVFLGGRIGSDSLLGDVFKKGVPCDELVELLVELLVDRFGAVPRNNAEGED